MLSIVDVNKAFADLGETLSKVGRRPSGDTGGFDRLGEYVKACWMARREPLQTDERLKDLSSATDSAGGFLVPEGFRDDLLALPFAESEILRAVQRVPMDTKSVSIPFIDEFDHSTGFHGMKMSWTEEGGTLQEDDPTFGRTTLTAKKLSGTVDVSNELIADSPRTLEAVLPRLMGESIRFTLEEMLLSGTGAGQPLGILNAPGTNSIAKETGQTAATITFDNVRKMYAGMLPLSQKRGIWCLSPSAVGEILKLVVEVGTAGSAVFTVNAALAPAPTIFGRPIYVSEHCATLGTVGDIIYADWSYYLLGDREELVVDTSPHAKFTTDQTVIRVRSRLDGHPWLPSTVTAANGTDTLAPFVTLATRA